jgi:hypothetical protein
MAKRTSNYSADLLSDAHHFYLATSGGAPAADSEIIAGTTSKSIFITGYSICAFGSADATTGAYAFTDGDIDGTANTIIHGLVASGKIATFQSLDLNRPVKLTRGNSLKLTSSESSGNVYVTGMIYYKIL